MLQVVASYHCMQFQGKLMNKLEKMAKNLILGPILAPSLGPQNFIRGVYFYYMLDIVANYPCMQFQRKLLIQTQEKTCTISEKTNDPILRKLSNGRTDGQTDELLQRTLPD